MSAERDYWRECVDAAASECGLVLTEEQAECLAGAFQGGHENYGMAFYQPPSGEHCRAEIKDLELKLKEEREKVVCPVCKGGGRLTSYGVTHTANSPCWKCGGDGKVKP